MLCLWSLFANECYRKHIQTCRYLVQKMFEEKREFENFSSFVLFWRYHISSKIRQLHHIFNLNVLRNSKLVFSFVIKWFKKLILRKHALQLKLTTSYFKSTFGHPCMVLKVYPYFETMVVSNWYHFKLYYGAMALLFLITQF